MDLLERERYSADLAEAFRSVAAHGGRVVLVGGEAGIGKTSLIQEFLKQQQGTRILWGACDALFTPRPLAPLLDIAKQTQGALLAAIHSGAARESIFSATLEELARTESIVVFEDMHWADEATLDLLKFIGRRIRHTRTLLAVTYRDDEVGPRHPLKFVIGDLPRESTQKMLLPPLSEQAVNQLASQSGLSSGGLYGITGGNPLFVTEVLGAGSEVIPDNIRDAVLARASRLSAAAREIAEYACIVPGKIEAALLEEVARPDEAGIEGCLHMGMLMAEDGALSYRHELVRRALEDSLPPLRRQALHAAVLSALAPRRDVPAARIAHHADGSRNAEAVLRFAPLAAAQAASLGAHREAASHHRIALRYAQGLAPEARAQLQERLSYECYLTGQHELGVEARQAALSIWQACGDRLRVGDNLRWLSRLSWFLGRRADADRYATEAVNTLESLTPGAELAMAYANRAQLDMEAHETEAAIGWARRAIAEAGRWSNLEVVCNALNTLGTSRLTAGDAAGEADLERSLQIALDGNLHEQIARGFTSFCAMMVSRRNYGKARELLRRGIAYCEEHDLNSWWLYLTAYSARMNFEQGEWNAAGENVEAVLRHPHTTPVTRIPALRTLGHLRIRRGDPDAQGPLAEAKALADPMRELQRFGMMAAVEAEGAWLQDDAEGVRRAAQPAFERVERKKDPRMKGELAIWLWRVGAITHLPADTAEPYAQEIAGRWQEAAQAWKALGCPYEQACTLGWQGARTEQLEALAIFEKLGAAPAAMALRKRMRSQGARGIPRGARKSTKLNTLGLTRREAQILELLAQGLRNSAIAKKLFLATKTVDHHVASILLKLNVRSRAEATAFLQRHAEEL